MDPGPLAHVLYSVSDRIATITVNRPDKLNALNDAVMADLDAAAAWAASHGGHPDKLAVTGFCWGGGTTNYLAVALGADLQAAAPFYGAAAETASVAKIKAPLLIHLAENDDYINALQPAFEAAMKAAGVRFEVHTYPGTQHGFHNDSTPRYNQAAAKLSWNRTVAFFRKNLA